MGSVDLGFFFQWYITILVLGVLFFPLTSAVFSRFSDKGYPLAKILGLGFTTYVVFNLGLARILQFNSLTIIIVICLISLVSSFIVIRKTGLSKKKLGVFLKSKWKLLLFEEVLFLVTLYFLSYIRAFSPDIHGLEKYMDFGFINSINRSDFFPPKDMWFTPFSINYYYFGHLATAVLTKISFLKTNITYNLMLATIFAMCVTASFSIAINLISNLKQRLPRKAYFFALISVLVVSLLEETCILFIHFSLPMKTKTRFHLGSSLLTPQNSQIHIGIPMRLDLYTTQFTNFLCTHGQFLIFTDMYLIFRSSY
jgi:uncharacterized membrane protein